MPHAVPHTHTHDRSEVDQRGRKHHAHACQEGQDDQADVGASLLLCRQ